MGRQSPYVGDLGRVVFGQPKWVVLATTPAAMMEPGRKVGPRAPSLEHAPADRNCNGLWSRSRGSGRKPLHSQAVHAEHSTRAWPPGPCRRSSCDARIRTSPANRLGHDGPPRETLRRPVGSAGRGSWTATVPFELDATQADRGALLPCAQGPAHLVAPLLRALPDQLPPSASGRARLAEEQVLDGCGSNKDERAIGNDAARRHQPTAAALHHGHHNHLRLRSIPQGRRFCSTWHPMAPHDYEYGYGSIQVTEPRLVGRWCSSMPPPRGRMAFNALDLVRFPPSSRAAQPSCGGVWLGVDRRSARPTIVHLH